MRAKKNTREWLAGQLANGLGMVAIDGLVERAKAAGYSRRTLYRAKADMGLESTLVAGKPYWQEPSGQTSLNTPEDRLEF